jgi:hypothetical protein
MIKEKKLFLIIGWNLLRATLSVLVAIFIVLFSTQKISKISESMMENKRTSFILEKRNEVIAELRKNFQLIGDKDKKIKEAIIPTDNILDFVAILESLASQNSLQQSLKFGTPALAVNDVSSIDYYTPSEDINPIISFQNANQDTNVTFLIYTGSISKYNPVVEIDAKGLLIANSPKIFNILLSLQRKTAKHPLIPGSIPIIYLIYLFPFLQDK